jgi:hypothetical protein
MPYNKTITYVPGASGAQASFDFDPSITPFNATITVSLLSSATATYKLQYTATTYGVTTTDSQANWFDSPDIPAGTATSSFASFLTPITRARIVFSANLATGNMVLDVIQGMSTN